MLTALGVIALVAGALVFVAVLALVAPVRIGFEIRAEDRVSQATGGLRLYGGLIGVGAQMRRGSREEPRPTTFSVGLLLWRWYWPVRELRREAWQPSQPPTRPDEGPWQPPGVPERAAARPSVTDRPALRREEPSRALPPPIMPQPPPKRPGDGIASAFRRAQGQWEEWFPVAREVYGRLRGLVRLRLFRVEGTLGTGDPALTGQVVGFAAALRGLEGGALRVRVTPDFERRTARGFARLEWRVSLRRIWSAGLYVGWVLVRRWWATRRSSGSGGRSA